MKEQKDFDRTGTGFESIQSSYQSYMEMNKNEQDPARDQDHAHGALSSQKQDGSCRTWSQAPEREA